MEENPIQNKTVREQCVTWSLLLGPLLLVIIFVTAQTISKPAEEPVPEVAGAVDIVEEKVKEVETSHTRISISARAAVVKDIRTGEIVYAKNRSEALPLASITKVMTALTATESLKELDVIEITERDKETEGDDTLQIGEKWNMKDIRDFTLISSSNDGASALASVAGLVLEDKVPGYEGKESFVAEMNRLAKEIGLKNTHFYNETGLDEEGKAGAYGSAEDIATLFGYIMKNHPRIIEATKNDVEYISSLDGLQHTVHNTNAILTQLPNVIGSKTGYTELAGGNLAVVVDAGLNDPVVIVVLGSSFNGRFEDVNTLAKEFVIQE